MDGYIHPFSPMGAVLWAGRKWAVFLWVSWCIYLYITFYCSVLIKVRGAFFGIFVLFLFVVSADINKERILYGNQFHGQYSGMYYAEHQNSFIWFLGGSKMWYNIAHIDYRTYKGDHFKVCRKLSGIMAQTGLILNRDYLYEYVGTLVHTWYICYSIRNKGPLLFFSFSSVGQKSSGIVAAIYGRKKGSVSRFPAISQHFLFWQKIILGSRF